MIKYIIVCDNICFPSHLFSYLATPQIILSAHGGVTNPRLGTTAPDYYVENGNGWVGVYPACRTSEMNVNRNPIMSANYIGAFPNRL